MNIGELPIPFTRTANHIPCKSNRKAQEKKMTTSITPLKQLPAWQALEAHAETIRGTHLRQLFADDPARGERFNAEAAGIFLDYSKHRITDETLKLFGQLAEQSGLRARIDAMFRGDKINITENRAVLHVALRAPKT